MVQGQTSIWFSLSSSQHFDDITFLEIFSNRRAVLFLFSLNVDGLEAILLFLSFLSFLLFLFSFLNCKILSILVWNKAKHNLFVALVRERPVNINLLFMSMYLSIRSDEFLRNNRVFVLVRRHQTLIAIREEEATDNNHTRDASTHFSRSSVPKKEKEIKERKNVSSRSLNPCSFPHNLSLFFSYFFFFDCFRS